MRDDAHGIEELAAEKLHADDSAGWVDLEILLQQEQVVGKPQVGTVIQQADQFRGGVQQEHARAAAALLGLQQGGPAIAPLFDRGSYVVECEAARVHDLQAAHEGGLRGLAEFEREGARAVEHPRAAQFERTHQREGERHGACIAPYVGAGAGLVEVERRFGNSVGVEGCLLQIETCKAHIAPLRAENRGFCHSGCSNRTTRS